MTSFLHGQDLVGDEILKNFSAIQALTTFVNNTRMGDSKLEKFIQKHSKFKTSNNRGAPNMSGLVYHGVKEYELAENIDISELIFNYNSVVLKSIYALDKLSFNNSRLTSRNVLGRFDDSCVQVNNSNVFGIIETFTNGQNLKSVPF